MEEIARCVDGRGIGWTSYEELCV
uniref:Uncharacterized protein n=1 Tax=Arundo donax TaxID=35708 RepID=A0A0A8Z4K9_ARUDO